MSNTTNTEKAEKTENKFPQFINMNPTWEDLSLVIANGAVNGDAGALGELNRMARLADKYVESQKK